ncbi:MAG: hypothetical protein CMM01_22835 [Rhodopirellula sp.]|nr:hypothetical protein [Rhodopirellula sp.]
MSEELPIQSRPRMGALLALLLLIAVLGLFGYYCNKSDWISAAATLAIAFAAFGGFKTGASKALAFLTSATATFYLAPYLGMQFENTFSDWVGTTGLANRFYAVLVTGLLVFLVTVIVTLKIGNRVLQGRPKTTLLNHWLGFLLGGIQGFLVVVILLGGMVTIQKVNAERLSERIPPTGRAKLLAEILDKTSQQTQASRLAPIVARFNPFEHIPQLSHVDEWQRGMEVLMDPSKVNALFDQPAIKELKNREDVSDTIAKLNEDPEITKLLNSNKPASKELAIKLLNHPAVLELLDQPEFRDAAMSAFRDAVMPSGTR